MGGTKFSVIITETAIGDLHEIDDYWTQRQKPERGEKYCEDLLHTAVAKLSVPDRALRGRLIKNAPVDNTREILVFKSSYRIVYRIAKHSVSSMCFASGTAIATMFRLTEVAMRTTKLP